MSFLKKLFGRKDEPEKAADDGMVHPTKADEVAAAYGGPETPTATAAAGRFVGIETAQTYFEADSERPGR